MSLTSSTRSKKNDTKPSLSQAESVFPPPLPLSSAMNDASGSMHATTGGRHVNKNSTLLPLPTSFPTWPTIGTVNVSSDPSAEYAVLVSMYEVYNDKIFDLLSPYMRGTTISTTSSTASSIAAQTTCSAESRRRPLLFRALPGSPDRKVVAGLVKIVCGTLQDALLVLEAGLDERRVAGTGSNSASSRSHGFFCVEVRKRACGQQRKMAGPMAWRSSTLTVVDLAGSERARDAKTHGATLAEAGKINESLMYLGQCLQMQSDMTASSVLSVAKVSEKGGWVLACGFQGTLSD